MKMKMKKSMIIRIALCATILASMFVMGNATSCDEEDQQMLESILVEAEAAPTAKQTKATKATEPAPTTSETVATQYTLREPLDKENFITLDEPVMYEVIFSQALAYSDDELVNFDILLEGDHIEVVAVSERYAKTQDGTYVALSLIRPVPIEDEPDETDPTPTTAPTKSPSPTQTVKPTTEPTETTVPAEEIPTKYEVRSYYKTVVKQVRDERGYVTNWNPIVGDYIQARADHMAANRTIGHYGAIITPEACGTMSYNPWTGNPPWSNTQGTSYDWQEIAYPHARYLVINHTPRLSQEGYTEVGVGVGRTTGTNGGPPYKYYIYIAACSEYDIDFWISEGRLP